MEYTRAKQQELTELVRQYGRALINYHKIPPFAYPTTTTTIEGRVEFGEVGKGAFKKSGKKKKTRNVYGDDSLRTLLAKSGRKVTKEELALLALQAKQAIELASELAGEPVVYCCAMLRIASTRDPDCHCRENEWYKIINKLGDKNET